MELTHLLYFKEAAETENMTKAAERLFISQSALSQCIKNLEEEIETPLFERTKNSIKLNDAGKFLLEHTNVILEEIETIKTGVKKFNSPVEIFYMASSIFPIPRIFVPIFNQSNTKYRLDYIILSETETKTSLLRNSVDIAALSEFISDESIQIIPLYEEQILLAVPKTDKLANKKSVKLEDIAQREILFFQNNPRGNINVLIEKTILEKNINIKLIKETDYIIFRQMQKDERYLFFATKVSKDYSNYDQERIYIPFSDPEFQITYYIAYLKKNKEYIKPILDAIKTYYKIDTE